MPDISLLIRGYDEFIEDRCDEGWSPWFCTVQCFHLNQGQAAVIETLRKESERIYRLLLTNIIRKPRRIESDRLPMLIGCADRPVYKREATARLSDIAPNNGMHIHFALLVPPENRLKLPLEEHVKQNMQVYVGNQRKVSHFDVRRYVPEPGKSLADYLFKHIKRNTFSLDDILVLPLSRTELVSSHKAIGDLPHR